MLCSDHTELLAAEGNGLTANKMNVVAGIAYQKLQKTKVEPPTVLTGQKFMCSEEKLELNHHHAHSSTRY